jgi:hypothetical protein
VPADVRKYWLDEFSSKQASSTAGEQAVIAGVKRLFEKSSAAPQSRKSAFLRQQYRSQKSVLTYALNCTAGVT